MVNRDSANLRGVPLGNPIANALVIVVGVLAIAAAIVLGFFAFLILSAIMTVLTAAVGVRLWWLRRSLLRAHGRSDATRPQRPGADVIEGEYRVLDRDSDRS